MKRPALNLTCPEIMNVEEVAGVLRLPVKTVRGLLSKEKLRGKKTGKAWRITKVDLEVYLRSSNE
jgi:excisionase family DNA binding protein